MSEQLVIAAVGEDRPGLVDQFIRLDSGQWLQYRRQPHDGTGW